MKKLFTDRQERQLCQEYRTGQTQTSLAAKYGCCQGTVKNVSARHLTDKEQKRIQGRRRRFTPEGAAKVCKAYRSGTLVREIAAKAGCSAGTVNTVLNAGLSSAERKRLRSQHLAVFLSKTGAAHPAWKGGRILKASSSGAVYAFAYAPDHPRANRQKYVLEHRLVMEKHLGRYLRRDEQVHHRNGKKTDNRLSNLQIVTHAHHGRVRCVHCGKTFEVH